MYDPKIARFLQEDTYRGQANDPLSLNYYTYCSNNPVVYWDPSGHWEQNDVNLNEDSQKLIIGYTNDYYDATSDEGRARAAAKARSVRDNNENYIRRTSKISDEAQKATEHLNNNKFFSAESWKNVVFKEVQSESKLINIGDSEDTGRKKSVADYNDDKNKQDPNTVELSWHGQPVTKKYVGGGINSINFGENVTQYDDVSTPGLAGAYALLNQMTPEERESYDEAAEKWTTILLADFLLADLNDIQMALVGYDFNKEEWIDDHDKFVYLMAAFVPYASGKAMKLSTEAVQAAMRQFDNGAEVVEMVVKGTGKRAKGLVGLDFEDFLTKKLGGNGSFSKGGRDFDGGIGNRWWEAKSGEFWDMLGNDAKKLEKFKSDMGARLRIAKDNGATYELFSKTAVPQNVKEWLDKKGMGVTEFLD